MIKRGMVSSSDFKVQKKCYLIRIVLVSCWFVRDSVSNSTNSLNNGAFIDGIICIFLLLMYMYDCKSKTCELKVLSWRLWSLQIIEHKHQEHDVHSPWSRCKSTMWFQIYIVKEIQFHILFFNTMVF